MVVCAAAHKPSAKLWFALWLLIVPNKSSECCITKILNARSGWWVVVCTVFVGVSLKWTAWISLIKLIHISQKHPGTSFKELKGSFSLSVLVFPPV